MEIVRKIYKKNKENKIILCDILKSSAYGKDFYEQ